MNNMACERVPRARDGSVSIILEVPVFVLRCSFNHSDDIKVL